MDHDFDKGKCLLTEHILHLLAIASNKGADQTARMCAFIVSKPPTEDRFSPVQAHMYYVIEQ